MPGKVNLNELHALENRVKALINKSKANLANMPPKDNEAYGPRRPSNNLLAAIERTTPAYVPPPSSRPITPVMPFAPRPSSPKSFLTTGAPVTIGAVTSHGGRTKKHRKHKKAKTSKRKTKHRR